MAKRALILQGGTMRGAYFVGVLTTFHRLLGLNYFDAIFSTSVGIFEQAFFASNQPYMENTWREYVHGRQLINPWNIFKGKPVLDLDYLVNLFQSDKSMLDLEAMKASHPNLFTFVTDYETKMPKMFDLKQGNVFDLMRAACALPFLYPKKVIIQGKRYIDARQTSPKKLKEIIGEKLREYDEVVGVAAFNYDEYFPEFVKVLKPTRMPLWGSLDTNRERIIETIKQGEIDAENFIKKSLINP